LTQRTPPVESASSAAERLADSAQPLAIQRSLERLRQERETFDQRRKQDHRWFHLRLAMGGMAVLVIPAIVGICVWILGDGEQSETVKGLAATALLVDVLSLVAAVWKVVLNPSSLTKLAPVTEDVDVSPE
jgi:hypothetical protein